MCGIVGIFNQKNAVDDVKAALILLQKRGKDAVGIATSEKILHGRNLQKLLPTKLVFSGEEINAVGHALHSIVGDVPQPLKGKGMLVANCEIYNWRKLKKKYSLPARNDADFLLGFLDKFGMKKLPELDGVYAFAYWKGSTLSLARDILGIKPLWYAHNNGIFTFASEKKVLKSLGHSTAKELNPRQILQYNLAAKTVCCKKRNFFEYLPEHRTSYLRIKEKTTKLLEEAIIKRIPQKKFGILFSGGVDSSFLAHILKNKGRKKKECKFTCYTAVFDDGKTISHDLIAAEKAASESGLALKVKKITLSEIPAYLAKIVPLIEDSNVVKVGVALPFYVACEMAKEDGCKVIFSGLGSEEIFAGYERHKQSANINQECVSGLLKMYERDLYRDDVVAMKNGLELRLPFLDKELVKYALKIPGKFKIKNDMGKYIFREIALEQGLPYETAFRKKMAAQYGSRFDNALGKLARINKFFSKSAYLKSFYPFSNAQLGALFSSGKDSTYAAYVMKKQNYQLSCLIHLKSKNRHSFMFQSAGTEIINLQAKAMKLPIIVQETKGEKEQELDDLKKALCRAKKKYQIEGVITGALFSTYQRDRIEKICDSLGLKIFSPLWHKKQEQQMQELLINDFHFIFTSIAADGLDKSWLNREITSADIRKLEALSNVLGVNVAGEGGEFESLVLDCPLFEKRIVIDKSEIVEETKNNSYLVIHKAHLEEKK